VSLNEQQMLPSSWSRVTLTDISAKIIDGSHNPPSKQQTGYPMLSARNIENGHIEFDNFRYISPDDFRIEDQRTQVRQGDVLLTIVGSIGRVAVVLEGTQPFALQRSVAVVRPIEVNARFCMYQLQSPQMQRILSELAQGTAQKGVYLKTLSNLQIDIAPLGEQSRIVAEIEKHFTRLDAAVSALKRIKANLKRYRASVLKAACEGRLVPTEAELAKAEGRDYEPADRLLSRILKERRAKWEADQLAKMKTQGKKSTDDKWKAKYEEPAAPDISFLTELSEGWAWSNMLTLTMNGAQNGLYLPQSAYGSGIPILRIDDYQNGTSRTSDKLRLVKAVDDDVVRYSLAQGDLIINRVNSMTHLGKCLIISAKNLPALFESNMMRLRLSENINPKFIEICLHTVEGRRRLIANAKWAVNQASINQTDVANVVVPLPPLAEQQRIVAEVERHISIIEELETVVEANLTRAERLRQSILKRAFEGKLVPQDPADEPASNLLERIRAEREKKLSGMKASMNKRRAGKTRQPGLNWQSPEGKTVSTHPQTDS
jgi:type I restriction enzyme S subunit